MEVAVIKHDAGNIRFVDYALKRLGVEVVTTSDKEVLKAADKVVSPGVEEAETTMLHLKESGMDCLIKELRQPVLGICLGMQLTCRFSEEGNVGCFGIFDTDVRRFVSRGHEDKVPRMGWDTTGQLESDLFRGFIRDEFVHSAHSYYVSVSKFTAVETDYIHSSSAVLHKDNLYATQFHPEKSGVAGERTIESFLEL